MSRRISKAEARSFRNRWQLVNLREEEELRSTGIDVKWQQVKTLFGWAHLLGWSEALREGEAEVRERWAKLRKMHRG